MADTDDTKVATLSFTKPELVAFCAANALGIAAIQHYAYRTEQTRNTLAGLMGNLKAALLMLADEHGDDAWNKMNDRVLAEVFTVWPDQATTRIADGGATS